MVAALAAVGAAKAAPKPSKDNAMSYLLAGVVGLWLLKSLAGKVLDPLGDIGGAFADVGGGIVTGTKAVVYVGDELTGGIQGDPRAPSTSELPLVVFCCEYLSEYSTGISF